VLKQRIVTALVLLAFLLPALLVKPAWPFALLVGIAFAAAGWEWTRLNDAGRAAIALGLGLGLACLLAFLAGWTTGAPRIVWWTAMALWVLGGVWVLRGGVAGWPRVPRPVLSAAGGVGGATAGGGVWERVGSSAPIPLPSALRGCSGLLMV
jgi:phosphatidate cytidylyltransferase